MQLGHLFDAYVNSLRLRARPGSMQQASVHLGHLTRHFSAGFDATELRLPDLEGFVARRLGAPVGKSCVNGSLGFLRAALRYGVDAELLPKMPCRVKKLRLVKKLPHVLAREEVERLLEAAPGDVGLMILLAVKAGLRHQEILHLTREDLTLGEASGGRVRVAAKAGWQPKNHQEREVPVGPTLRAALARHLRALEGRWLFPTPGGGAPVTNVTRPVRNAFRSAGLYTRNHGLHSLRRTWATNLVAVADIETVRQLGGWADLTTVQRYLNSTDERKREAIAALDV